MVALPSCYAKFGIFSVVTNVACKDNKFLAFFFHHKPECDGHMVVKSPLAHPSRALPANTELSEMMKHLPYGSLLVEKQCVASSNCTSIFLWNVALISSVIYFNAGPAVLCIFSYDTPEWNLEICKKVKSSCKTSGSLTEDESVRKSICFEKREIFCNVYLGKIEK